MGLFNFLLGSSAVDTTPSTNIDGTPMYGNVDVNGNPYGVTETHDIESVGIDDTVSPCTTDDSFSCFDSSCGIDDSFSSFDDNSCGWFDDW